MQYPMQRFLRSLCQALKIFNMRITHTILAFILFPILFISCKKDHEQYTVISGSWELRAAYNGQGGVINYPAGNGNLLKFTPDTYQKYSNGAIQQSGTYKIIKHNSQVLGGTRDRIVYDNDMDSPAIIISLSHDSLMFSLDAYDGPGSLYIKE
jgi:hypothetical protein